MRTWIAPRVRGIDLPSPNVVYGLLARDFRGHLMAKAAIEMGVWELAAQLEGVPLSRKLGGTRDRIATGISLGIQQNPEALVALAQAARSDGYRKIKIKIMPGQDLDYVAAVRDSLGMSVDLMADANSAYTLGDAAVLRQLDTMELTMIEQPLGRDDLVRHAALQQSLRTPLCLDESIIDLERAEDMVTLGSGRIINIKPGRVGGFTASLAIHDFCWAHHVPVWCGGMLESGVGRAHNVALASLPNFKLPGDLSPSARYWERDIVTPEWTMDAGMVRVPLDRPGMGVTVDMDRIDNLTVRRDVIGA
jgi:O-succinylbenzoate synthase